MSRYEFAMHTFGCKVNVYDSGLLQRRLQAAGGAMVDAKSVAATDRPRVHVLNTCAVTAEATREAARAIRRIKSREPFATVVVTGCAAQVDGGVLDALPGADLIVANSHKGDLENLLDRHFAGTLGGARVHRSNIFRKSDVEPGGGVEAGHTRAFLKIQDGCNSFCTYCVIPFARGKSRSVPIRDLVRRARELSQAGAAEIALTGVHIGDYEDSGSPTRPNGRGLVDLIEALLADTDVSRLRLTSIEPGELSDELLALYRSTDRLCRHFHVSVQAACTRVLTAMRRDYDADAVTQCLNAIEEHLPGAFVGMDVIAGFPSESAEEFAEGYERLAELPWTRIHAFPFSERPGTKAERIEPSVPLRERALRADRLRALSAQRFESAARAQIGARKLALALGSGKGLTRDYWPVRFAGDAPAAGRESAVSIIGFERNETTRMEGRLVASSEIN